VAKQKLNAEGFKLPSQRRSQDLPPETIEAFADAPKRARKSAKPQNRKPAKSQNRKPAKSQNRKPAKSRTPDNAPLDVSRVRPRSGTAATPYVRSDGTETRSTSVHLEVTLHRRLRLRALEENRSMSDIIAAALVDYLG